jgi:hypothetical protein
MVFNYLENNFGNLRYQFANDAEYSFMTIPGGTEIYCMDYSHVKSRGLCYSENELKSSLKGRASKILFDDEGTGQLEINLSSIVDTDFEAESVKRIISSKRKPENWSVGEALAESYLTCHRKCFFPWPSSRDQKNPKSSPTGADIVGFQEIDNQNCRFAFGEVKTSDQKKCPPSVIYGPHGLKQQLKDLCVDCKKKDSLVLYLGHHSEGSSWGQQYKEAAKRYIKNSEDLSLFGFMVRDVTPNKDDLRDITEELAANCSPPTSIELLALYLPVGSIENLSSKVKSAKIEGD